MAAEKLIEAGEKLNYNVRVETNGSAGVENGLTQKKLKMQMLSSSQLIFM